MHDLKWIESNIQEAQKLLERKGDTKSLDELVLLIKKRREKILAADELKQKRNQINDGLKTANKDEIDAVRIKMRELAANIKFHDEELVSIESKLEEQLLNIPNFPLPSVPDGKSEQDNVVVKHVLEKTVLDFEPKDHIEIGELTDTIDTARAAKISGTRFAFLKGQGSKLNRALIQFFTDFHVNQGDTELTPPYMVKEQAMIGTGQLPKFKDDAFIVSKEGKEEYFLIPTAEVPVTNYLADEIIPQENLPLRFCAYSACFRAEAGAAGRDTRGMIRLHQFEKVEMVRFAKPEDCLKELDLMVERASKLLTLLELPHRIVELCTGDLSFGSEKTIDIEVFLPSQNTYREISSCSSFGSFQARRAKIRYKSGSDKPKPLATLNGSGLPLGRTIVALYENHQQADGSVKIPKVLQEFMGAKEILVKK